MPAANQEYLEIIEQLRPIDDLFMRFLFRNNRELTQRVLNILLNQEIEIESLDTQADIINISGSKSIRPDVLIVDTKGVYYDLEIQRDIYQLSNKRWRYYVDSLDVQYLKQGMDYDSLPKLYIICITEFDYFGKGEAIYEIKKTVKDIQELDYDDEVYILYVNGEYRGRDEIGMLMHDFSCSDFRDMYIIEMRESVKRAKTIEMEESDMCEALEKFRDKAIAEGMAQGMAQGKVEGKAEGISIGKLEEKMKIAYKLKIEGMSEEKIASFVECSIFQVKEWLSKSNDCLV